MKSMTGFGMGEYVDETTQITVEIKTINHRYKDFNIRLSKKYAIMEDMIRKYVSKIVSRGRVEIGVKIRMYRSESASIQYNYEIAKQYKDAIDSMKLDFPQLADDVGIAYLSRCPEVITEEETSLDMDALWKKAKLAFDDALAMLDHSRETEGEELKLDFVMRCDLIREYCNKVTQYADEIPKEYYENLMKHVESYTQGILDEQRLMTEMAIYADRSNITEELVRMDSHLKNFEKIISLQEPIGRKLDFLFQEINREANTIASKSNSFEISTLVVEIKSELEKMREQIQNIE